MKLLLDTHVLVWAAYASPKLAANTVALIGDKSNQRFFSVASIWEIAIKARLGRPDFRVEASLLQKGLLANGYFELPIRSAHAIAAAKLPFAHKDPFDRMLLAQALEEGLTLLSADDALIVFGPPVMAI